MSGNFRQRTDRFMQGRYGADRFFRFQLIAALVLFCLGWLSRSGLLQLPAWALLLWGLWRAFSRNIAARSRENGRYLAACAQAQRWLQLQSCRWRDRKTHRYFSCPKCGSALRVPKDQGRVVVTCARCGWQFERRT